MTRYKLALIVAFVALLGIGSAQAQSNCTSNCYTTYNGSRTCQTHCW